jgi:flagellar assembly protein FliH
VAWFDQSGPNKLSPAQFDDVTPRQRRQPSWLVKGRRPSSPVTRITLPPPPAIPSELVPASLRIENADNPDQHIGAKRDATREHTVSLANEASRPSMTPVELEALVAERATRKVADQILKESQTAILEAVHNLVSAHERLSEELSDRSVELAILIARRVIARELQTQPDIVTDLVREGLEVLNVRDRVRVHLGSEFAVLKDELVAHFSASGTMIDANLDSTLPAYGCVVETEVGSVDESIESRLDALLEAMATHREV